MNYDYLRIGGCFAFLSLGAAQIVAGFVGIQDGLGTGWAFVALIAAFIFRFLPPIVIGAFFGAMNVWGWHWALAAIFVFPPLAFFIPGVFLSVSSYLSKRFKR